VNLAEGWQPVSSGSLSSFEVVTATLRDPQRSDIAGHRRCAINRSCMSAWSSYRAEVRPTLALATPIIVGQVSQMLMGVTDSVMIGHAGTVPLAASSFGGNVFAVFYVVGIGTTLPVGIFAAHAHGAKKPDEAGDVLRHGLALALLFGALEMLVMALLSTQLARFGQPAEVLAIVTPFFLLIASSIVPVLVYLVLRQFAEAMGRQWVPMLVMLGGVGLNAALNWIFIYGHLGVPALGLTGAGISTLISRTLGAWIIWEWLRRDPAVRAAWPERWLAPLSRARLREMLHLGVPAAGMLLFESTAFAFSSIMMGWLGAVPLAAHQIALTCASLSFMFPLGLAMATGMRVGRAVGAGEPARLRPIAFGAMAMGIVVTGAFGLSYGLGGRAIAGWFVHDVTVVGLAAQLLVVAGLFQLVDGLQVIGAASLRGLKDVRVPAAITFAAYWLIALPLGYGLGIRGKLGALGIWVGIASGLAFAAVFLAARLARRTR
jgi:multidrug resistance protein, MATE family